MPHKSIYTYCILSSGMDSVLKRFNLAGLQQRLEALGVSDPVTLANIFDDQAAFCHQFRGIADASNLAACFAF
eukprot:6439904-Karenia_brevis.AAC.1